MLTLGAALHGQGNLLLAQEAWSEAKTLFQQALEQQQQALATKPNDISYREWLCRHLCRLSTACGRLGQSTEAKDTGTMALQIFEAIGATSDAAVQDDVAWMLIDGSEIWDANTTVATAEAAVQRMPSSAALWMTLGVGRCRSRRWQKALDALSEADRLGVDDSGLQFFLAMAHWQSDQRLEALAWYERAVESMHEHAARESQFLRCRAEADTCIGSALAILGTEQPEGTDTWDRLPACQAPETGRMPIPLFVCTLKRFGNTSGSVTVDWATSDGTARAGRDYVPASGQVHFADGEAEQHIAVAVYGDSTTERAEDFVVSLTDVAGATVAQRRALGVIVNDDAHEPVGHWDMAVRLDPDSAAAHFQRAVARSRASDQDDAALADFSRAIELAPEFAQAYYNRSLIALRQNRATDALRDLEQALALGFHRAAAFNNRGVLQAVVHGTDGTDGTNRTDGTDGT